jgi:LmeA-like phospholipid-binding
MSEEPTRPSPQWQPPQAPHEPPTRAWQPQAPQSPPPQNPPPPAWQAQGAQSPPPPAWQAQAPQDSPPAWQAQAPQDSPPAWQGQSPQDSPPWQGQGPYGSGQGSPAPVGRRRRRRWPWITLIVIVLVLVAADRGALAITENAMASQFQSSVGLSGKPHVSIPGFPFLTQLAARDFKTVNVNATNETTGPLEIASLTATAHGMHIHGLNSAEIDSFTASALVTFTALGNAGGIPQGITLSADGPNKIQASVNIGPISDSATAQVTQTGPNKVNIHIIDAGGIPTSILGSLMNFTITIPKLPAGVSIHSISITQQGLMITATGSHVTVSQNS